MSTATVQSATIPLGQRPHAGQASSRSVERDKQRAVEVAEAFGVLLASARVEIAGGDSKKNAKLAGQIFEAPGNDRRQHRADALRANDGQRALSRDPRLDQTSVEARRAGSDAKVAADVQGTKLSQSETRVRDTVSHSDPRLESTWPASKGQANERANASALSRDTSQSAATSKPDALPRSRPESDQSAVPTTSQTPAAGNVTPKATGAVQSGPTPNPAESVGRVLGAARVGEIETARALTPGQSAQGQPEARGKGKSTAGETGRSESQAKSSGTGQAEKPAATEPREFDRLIRSLQVLKGGRQSQARMVLDPPELGRMWVSVRMDGDQLQLDVRTETEAARQLIGERIQALRDALRRHGIDVQRLGLSVVASTDEGDNAPALRSPLADARETQRWSGRTESESTRAGRTATSRHKQQMDDGPLAERRLDVSI